MYGWQMPETAFSKSRHSMGHLFWRCFIDCGERGAGRSMTSFLRGHTASSFHFPSSHTSLIHSLNIWSHDFRGIHVIQIICPIMAHRWTKKAVWDSLLDSVKPNASGKQRFDLKLNSPIYEHAILNTRSTLSTTIFWVSRTGCLKKEHGLCHMCTSRPISSFRIVFQMNSGEQ